MGVVYRAHDEELQRSVALKGLPPGLLAEELARRRFRKEALAKLSQPNIATVHEFGNEHDLDFLVTEYIAGETLDQKLVNGPLAEKEVVRLGGQLAQGLEAAHAEGIVHRWILGPETGRSDVACAPIYESRIHIEDQAHRQASSLPVIN